MVDVMSINRTISLERLFVVYYHDRDWSGTYVYPEEMLHINTWMDEGWIKFVPTPQVLKDAGWPDSKHYKITEKGLLLLEFNEL